MKVSVKIAIASVLTLVAATSVAEEVEKRLPADPRGEVEIVNVAGSVRVSGWNRAEVDVRADLDDKVERLDFTSEGGRTVINVVLPRHRSHGGGSDLVVRIPENSTLNVRTVSADQEIDGVNGAQRLQAVSGLIRTETGGEDFQAKTISGDVAVTGPGDKKSPALYRVTTVSGDLTMVKVSGDLDVETVSGDMRIEAGELSRARIRTTNGDVDVHATLSSDARFDAETINGDVVARFAGTVDAEFDIHTFNGDIETCFGSASVREREHGPGQDLNFTHGTGKGRVRVKTLNGGVSLCGK